MTTVASLLAAPRPTKRRPTSTDRARARALLLSGASQSAAARACGVAVSTVRGWARGDGLIAYVSDAAVRAAIPRAPSQRAAVLLAVEAAHRADGFGAVVLAAVWSALADAPIDPPRADARISDLVAAGLAERSSLDGARAVRLTPAGHSRARAVALEVRP